MNKSNAIKSNHITSDGKSFSDLGQATAHQESLDLEARFTGVAGAYVETVAFPKAESVKGLAAAKTMKRKDVVAMLAWLTANGVDLAPVADEAQAAKVQAAKAAQEAQEAQAAQAAPAAQAEASAD